MKHGTTVIAFVEDPDGYRIELIEKRPASREATDLTARPGRLSYAPYACRGTCAVSRPLGVHGPPSVGYHVRPCRPSRTTSPGASRCMTRPSSSTWATPSSRPPSATPAAPRMADALAAMTRLEAGALANPDEGRMVGHYWLRDPARAPDPAIAAAITDSWQQIDQFATDVRSGTIAAPDGQPFRHFLLAGIGGSALGPQLLADALGAAVHPRQHRPRRHPRHPRRIPSLAHTLVLVVSKSGGTVETRNAMLEVAAACRDQGLEFARQAVAVTGDGSTLDTPRPQRRLARHLPDVGLGRRPHLRARPRRPAPRRPPRPRLARPPARRRGHGRRHPPPVRRQPRRPARPRLARITAGHGARAMVMLPYADRLVLLSRYLQQLVMESLGKRLDRQRPRGRPGPHRLRQQGLHRPARLRPAAARRPRQLLRHLRPRPRRRDHDRRRARRHLRRLPRRLLSGHPRRPPPSVADRASPSPSTASTPPPSAPSSPCSSAPSASTPS
jgi:hypothetical protein